MIIQAEYYGNPFLGLFMTTNEEITFVPKNIPEDLVHKIEECLETEVVPISVYNSSLIGLFMSMNSRGAVLPEIAYSDEVKEIGEYLDEIVIIEDFTAIGNLIALNDEVALVSPVINKEKVKEMESALKVRVIQTKIANMDVTGSLVALTNKGFVLTPLAKEEEFRSLEDAIGIEGVQTTVNYGNPMVKSGVVANSNGAIVGSLTTPYELGRIDEGLFLR